MDLLDMSSPQRHAETWVDCYIDHLEANPYDMAADLPWDPEEFVEGGPVPSRRPALPAKCAIRIEPLIPEDSGRHAAKPESCLRYGGCFSLVRDA
jgi:hypothetical protein